eukprot:551821-Amorphochlora_amoeboformis.AAC.2
MYHHRSVVGIIPDNGGTDSPSGLIRVGRTSVSSCKPLIGIARLASDDSSGASLQALICTVPSGVGIEPDQIDSRGSWRVEKY